MLKDGDISQGEGGLRQFPQAPCPCPVWAFKRFHHIVTMARRFKLCWLSKEHQVHAERQVISQPCPLTYWFASLSQMSPWDTRQLLTVLEGDLGVLEEINATNYSIYVVVQHL